MGFVQIKHLEELLDKKAQELSVKRIDAEFQGFTSERTAVVVTPDKEEILLPYDVLVGADGAHSKVREALAIERNCLGIARGASALIPDTDSKEVDISPAIKKEGGFLRRIRVPSASIVFVQFPLKASKNDLRRALEAQGWSKEAKAVDANRALVLEDIEILLHRANSFSDGKKSAILVGEAAAAGSFFQGMGANTALKTAEVAGRFFAEIRDHNKASFQNYNQSVREVTDVMIEDCSFLFSME